MNGKQAKKLRNLAAMFYQSTPKDKRIKAVEEIYDELKKVHKIKAKK